jgi:hypothetical protein
MFWMGAIGETLKAEFLDNTNSSKTVVLQLVQGEGIPAKMGNLPLMDIEFQSRLLDDNIGYIAFNAFFDKHSRIVSRIATTSLSSSSS